MHDIRKGKIPLYLIRVENIGALSARGVFLATVFITRPGRGGSEWCVARTLTQLHAFITTKGRNGPLFVLKLTSLSEPGFHGVRTVSGFPFFQRLVVAAFGLDNFAGVRVFVDLNLPRLTRDRLGLCT